MGKIRKRFIKRTMTPMGLDLMGDIKKVLDPKNVFAANNTIYREEGEEEADMAHGSSGTDKK